MPFIGNQPTAVPLTSADIQDGTIGIADLSATGTKDSTTFLRGDNTFTSAGGANTPAFFAVKNTTQSPSNNAGVKITYETEIFDTNNAFASSRFTVPSGQAGRYFLFFQYLNNKTGVISENYGYFLLNGSSTGRGFFDFGGTNPSNMNAFVAVIFDLSVGDYVEVQHYSTTTDSSAGSLMANYNTFGGYKIIE